MLALANLYVGLLHYLRSVTGVRWLDGSIGVVLALYICSRPAINAWEWLFFSRPHLRLLAAEWSGLGWLALNTIVLGAGWVVLFTSLTRIVGRAT
jgi:hypothetical protein